MRCCDVKILKYYIKKKEHINLKVFGNCMQPWINDDEIWIHNYKKPFQIGDIVLVYSDESLRVHRIVDIKADGSVITKGDMSFTKDKNIDPFYIIGYVYTICDFDPACHKLILQICKLSLSISNAYSRRRDEHDKKIDYYKKKISEISHLIIKNGWFNSNGN